MAAEKVKQQQSCSYNNRQNKQTWIYFLMVDTKGKQVWKLCQRFLGFWDFFRDFGIFSRIFFYFGNSGFFSGFWEFFWYYFSDFSSKCQRFYNLRNLKIKENLWASEWLEIRCSPGQIWAPPILKKHEFYSLTICKQCFDVPVIPARIVFDLLE